MESKQLASLDEYKYKAVPTTTSLCIENYEDYRSFLRAQIALNRHIKGYQTILAFAAKCHPSYITQVLKQKVNLTPDQAAGLSNFWRFSKGDAEFFILLVQHARATTTSYREIIKTRIEDLRGEKRNLADRFKTESIDREEIQQLYYSTWYYAAIHVLLSIPDYQTVQALVQHLEIPSSTVEKVLNDLTNANLVKRVGRRWQVTKHSIHLAKASPFLEQHLSNWRQRAVLSSQQKKMKNIHYTAVHALSHSDAEKLRQLIIDFLSTSRAIVEPSIEEEAICINLDLFEL